MSKSTRFPVAVHVLIAIAVQEGKPVPSEMIAQSVNSHPTVIRRILSMLNSAGITHAKLGKGGGALLAKETQMITLLDVYKAVEKAELLETPRARPNHDCVVGRNILPILCTIMGEAQKALEEKLNSVTLKEVSSDVLKRGELHGGNLIRL